jgi:hypothetical protein
MIFFFTAFFREISQFNRHNMTIYFLYHSSIDEIVYGFLRIVYQRYIPPFFLLSLLDDFCLISNIILFLSPISSVESHLII